MAEPFSLRRATAADSRRAFDVFLPAARDLTARQGVPWNPDAEQLWPRLAPLLDHLAAHAAEWWVAENDAGKVIGYARSVERGGLFELSELFVDPDHQSAGVGGALLARAFPDGRGEVRTIIATTDVRAQARYYRAGTAARFPIFSLEGPPRADGGDPTVEAIRLSETDDLSPLARIERAVLEFDRGREFAWLLHQREGYVYRRGGLPIAFGFLGASGSGPIAALQADDQPAILAHLEARAAEIGIDSLSFEVPAVNEAAMGHLLARGFRIDPFLTLLMSSRPFGQFDRFIGFSPPFVL